MTRTMYDSTTPAAIPSDAEMVAAYIDGRYEWTAQDLARFTDAVKLGITVTGAQVTDILDVETGDATPAHVPGWITDHRKLDHPHRATIYCNRDTLPSVIAVCNGAGFAIDRDYVVWLATLDGTARVDDMTGIVAVQDQGAAALGFHADSSIVYDDTWHPSKPVDPPIPQEEQDELAEIQAKARQISVLATEIHALASQ